MEWSGLDWTGVSSGVKCGVSRSGVSSGVWSGVWSVECGVSSVECGVWSVECGVWSVECGVSSRVEWSGVEWSGVEWSGVEWSGMDWTGLDWTRLLCRVEWSVEWSVECSGVECSAECGVWSVECGVWSVKWSGLKWSGVEWSGVEWTGLDWSVERSGVWREGKRSEAKRRKGKGREGREGKGREEKRSEAKGREVEGRGGEGRDGEGRGGEGGKEGRKEGRTEERRHGPRSKKVMTPTQWRGESKANSAKGTTCGPGVSYANLPKAEHLQEPGAPIKRRLAKVQLQADGDEDAAEVQQLEPSEPPAAAQQPDHRLHCRRPQAPALPQLQPRHALARGVPHHLLQQRHQTLVCEQRVGAEVHLLHKGRGPEHRDHRDEVAICQAPVGGI